MAELTGAKVAEPVEITETPIHLSFHYNPGVAASRFLTGIEKGRIVAETCPECGKTYVPPRGACSMCGVATQGGVELTGIGTVASFAVVSLPDPRLPSPYVTAWIKLDGSDITSMFLVGDVDASEVHLGMRVEPVWLPEDEWQKNLTNIKWYRPNGEPDAPYESYKDYV
ncbi:MAG TPA: Zn-ribbon domain-containing OB-fold protein [Mycobacteriales bacterium]|nr:Zn-ribbon domain-containing OB-fold protein [Mycobacteriales bacterium]